MLNLLRYGDWSPNEATVGPDELESCPCPLCGTEEFIPITLEWGALRVGRCAACHLIYVNPCLKDLEQFYNGDQEAYYDEARMIFDGHLPHHRDPNYTECIQLLERYQPGGRLLDVGTGLGVFLHRARERGWITHGVDPSSPLSELAKQHFNLDVKTCFLDEADFPESYFDAITLIDVFEHINTPMEFLRHCHRLLKPGGHLLVKVPNGAFNLLKLRLFKALGWTERYSIFNAYEHVVHYTPRTLSVCMERAGFEVRELTLARPVQTPVWQHYVGHYFQYPSPFYLDPVHTLGRSTCYWLARLGKGLSGGKVPSLASSLMAVATPIKAPPNLPSPAPS